MKDKISRAVVKCWQGWVKPFLVIVVVLCTLRSAVADWNDVPTGSMIPTILEGDRIVVNKLAYDLKIPFTTRHVAEWADPQRGDVVILFAPDTGDRLVKRVVGLPGDSIEMRGHRLFINGQPISYAALDPSLATELERDIATEVDQDASADRERSLATDRVSPPELPYRLYSESLGDASHPVMFTPRGPNRPSFARLTLPPDHYFVMGDNRDNSRDSRYFGPVERHLIVGKVLGVALSVDPDHYYLPRWHRFLRGVR